MAGANQPGTNGGNSTFKVQGGTVFMDLEGGQLGNTYGCGPSAPCNDPRRGGNVLVGTGYAGGAGGLNGNPGTASQAGGGGGTFHQAGGNGGTQSGFPADGSGNNDGGTGGGVQVTGDSTARGGGGGASGCGSTSGKPGQQGVVTFEFVSAP
jgi:hypothetical protein